jgi:hypothetical protein
MKSKIKEFWFWYDEAIIGIAVVFSIIFGSIGLLFLFYTVGWSNQYRIDCNLATGPSLSTTFWTNKDAYAYDPEGFCATLRERIAKE